MVSVVIISDLKNYSCWFFSFFTFSLLCFFLLLKTVQRRLSRRLLKTLTFFFNTVLPRPYGHL